MTYFKKSAAECAAFEEQAAAAQKEIADIVYRPYRVTGSSPRFREPAVHELDSLHNPLRPSCG